VGVNIHVATVMKHHKVLDGVAARPASLPVVPVSVAAKRATAGGATITVTTEKADRRLFPFAGVPARWLHR
jgi:hypothetical protein